MQYQQKMESQFGNSIHEKNFKINLIPANGGTIDTAGPVISKNGYIIPVMEGMVNYQAMH